MVQTLTERTHNLTSTPLSAYYTVTPTSGAGCVGDTFTVIVTVNPALAITPMDTTVCSGLQFTVTPQNLVNGTVPPGTTYSWGPPGGLNTGGTAGSGTSISGTLINPTNTPQNSTYTVYPTIGSFQGAPFIVTITVNPVSAITPMTFSVCSGLPFIVTPVDPNNGVVLSGTTYSWLAPQITRNSNRRNAR